MNTKKIVLILCLFTFSGLLLAERAKLYGREMLVRVETDPGFMELEEYGITSLLNSVPVAYKAINEVLGQENVPELLTIPGDHLGAHHSDNAGKLFGIYFVLDSDDESQMALAGKQEEILEKIIVNFRQALTDSYVEYAEDLNSRIQLLQQQADEAEAELRELTASLANMAPPAEELKRRMAEMEEALRDSQFEVDVNKQLLESLKQRKDQMRQRLEEKAQHDEVQQQMRQMMQQLEKQIQTVKVQVDSGVAPPSQLNEIEQKMIQARIEMARRAEEMRNVMGGRILPELDEQIAERSLDVERMRMKAEHLARNLEQNAVILHDSADREIMRIKLEAARDHFARTLELLNEAKLRQKLQMPPKVIVIEAKD